VKDGVEDALAATRAAVDEGIVPGGGIALMRSIEEIGLEKVSSNKFENVDEETGYNIIIEACKSPFNTIISNAGGKSGEVIWTLLAPCSESKGWNVRTEDVCNMYEAGIIDPTRVTRTALEKAASVAGTMLITECVVTKLPEEKDEKLPAGGFGMMQ